MIPIDVKRRENESPLDYHKRIVYGKLVDKTLADMDYTEIAELIYGQPYASDVARRMLYGSRRTLELMDSERADSAGESDVLGEIEEKIIELKKERQKFFDQRRELTKIVSADSRKEHLYDTLAAAAKQLNQTIGVLYNDKTDVDLDVRRGDNEAVLVFSDWHYGMVTDNVFNKYNIDICKQRVHHIVKQAAERVALHKCSRLHVVLLGDMFHGAIHTSARVASEELVCDQIMQVAEIIAQSIEYLSRFVSEVCVYSTYGNHGRTVQEKKKSIHKDNMERLIPWWLGWRLKEHDRIYISEEDGSEFIFIDAAGHEICASHGDLDNVKSSPRILPTLFQKQYGKDIEYILLADKHHLESFEELGVTSQICGALCGSDDYANDRRLYSTPFQLMLIVNPSYGVDAEYKLKVQ